ncbi:unnamed protein product [Notodromas monacha]|uniref:HIF-1 alpha C-terminal transactivation domain-containing protein n=1 Tax=Notodromas monacha TaxID=399045 RepID=A0A7R9GFH9_9CRUS|nr:unnamed protein product [Notodromas monacha]CAG0919372.1 unnamed protein product [Notodromas monacha]
MGNEDERPHDLARGSRNSRRRARSSRDHKVLIMPVLLAKCSSWVNRRLKAISPCQFPGSLETSQCAARQPASRIEAPSGKKVKNWLMNETTLTAAVSPERLSRDTIEPMPRFVVPALSPGKKAPVKMASKPAKSRSRPVPAKLRNGMKKPFSKNVILGQTYPFSGTDIDWRLKARLSAELRGTGNFITPKQVMPARKEVPKENATQKPVVQLARVEQKGPIHQVQHVLRSPVAQIVKVMPAKQLPAAKDVKTGSPVYFRALAPKAIPAKRAADLKAGDLVAAVGKKLKLPAASAPPPHPPPPPPLVSAAIQTPASLGKPVKTSGEFLCALSVNEARKTNVSRPAGVISMDQLTTVNGRRALGDGTVTGGLLLVNVLLSGNSAECASATSGVSTRNVREGVVEIGRLGKSFSTSLLQPEMQGIPSLLEITQQDCDVNAPLSNTNGLLQGSDLLHALEMSDFTD